MAGAVELATAYIALVPSLKGASQGITSQLTPAAGVAGAEGGASLGGALLGGLSKFAAPIAGIVAAFSVGKLVKDSIKDFQDYQGAVNGFGRIAGGTTKEYSGLREAIKLSGVDVDAAQGGLTIFSKNLGNASQDGAKASAMAKKLGTDFLDAHGQVKPMSDILPGLSDKFKAMPDGAEKTALAMQLFGRSGTQMLPFLNQGSEGIAKLTAQAGKMGLILDDTDKKIFSASKAGVREYQESIKGLHVAIGSTVLPAITAFGNVGRSITIPMIQALAGVIQSARGPVMAFAGHIQALADRMRAATEGIITLFTKGDFTGGLGKALGLEEDSKIIGFMFDIRDAAKEVTGGFRAMFAAYKAGNGDVTSGGFAGVMERIGNGAREVTGGIRAFFAAFKAGGDDITSSGFAGFLEGLGLQARKAFDAIGPALAPLMDMLKGIDFSQVLGLASAFSPLQIIFKALEPVLPQLLSAFGQLASTIGGALLSTVMQLAPVFMQLSQTIISTLSGAFIALMPTVVSLIGQLSQVFTILVPIIGQVIAAVIPLVATLITQLAPIFAQLVQQVLPPLVSVIGNIVSAIGPLIVTIASMLVPIIQALMPVVVTVFSVIASVITSVMQIVMGVIQVVTGIISGNWSMVWEGIQNIFSGIWNTIVAVVSGALQIVGSVITAGLSLVGDVVGAALGAVGSFFADTFNNTITNVSSFIGTLLSFFGGLPGQIMGALGNVGSWLVDSGKALIQGFIDGIKGMVSGIGDAVGGVMDFAKQFFPHSPAKRGPFSGSGYTSFSGQALARDFAKGIASQNDVVADAAAGIMTSASLTGHIGISSALQNNHAGRSGATNNWTINQVDDPIGTAHAIARRQNAVAV